MGDPLISLIIPTYNRAHLIGETLDSIIAQTYNNWECIVIDDISSDYTEKLMEFYCSRDNRIKYFSRPINKKKGPNSCRNHGYELSNGIFINWIDSDDILFPKALEKKILNIGTNDIVISTLHYIDEHKKIIPQKHQFRSANLIEDYLIGKITFYTFTPLWSKTFIEKQSELFDERLSNLDDWDFNLRMLYSKPKMVFLDEALILYRVHNESLSHEIHKMNFEEIKSEVRARKKHVMINLKNKIFNGNSYYKFILGRNKSFLREAFVANSNTKYYLFLNLIFVQLILKEYKGITNSFLALIGYTLVGKGYRFLK
ncbi:glycosyltransferase family 2 protein [Gillisia sp. Hel_I_29]|uniref:glycosyltransferase family 2 protein n=1 Tax=Gillisia sp. Hel_I_29 TaxID=1249975 RepID=UPI00068DCD4C|nr:glycosyltransferase [Gillisia sp. Hel_I_29]